MRWGDIGASGETSIETTMETLTGKTVTGGISPETRPETPPETGGDTTRLRSRRHETGPQACGGVLRRGLGRKVRAIRRELAAVARRLAGDELEVLVLIARRLDAGRASYGDLDVRRDRRDFVAEATDELVDAAAYLAMGALRSARRAADSSAAVVGEDSSTATGPLGKPTATLRRSEREELRVTPGEWNGRLLCDVRVWRRRDGESIAEKRGIALRPAELLGVADALRAALTVLEAHPLDGGADDGHA